MAMSDRWRMPSGLRRTSAVVAVVALVIAGAKVASDYTMPGSGFSTVQTAAAEPTGPPGPTGGPGMDGGQQFQPPQMPSSMPDYQGGNNQPPLNQDNGVSIYNTGSPGAQQVPGQQAGQQPQQAQQPAHGTQPPNYQTATPYTQGPGQANPDYHAPQQNSPQQPQQDSQQQQPQQQPSQAPTQTQQPEQPQNQQDQDTKQLDQRKMECDSAGSFLGVGEPVFSVLSAGGSIIGGKLQPGSDPPTGSDGCGCSTDPLIKSAPSETTNHWWGTRHDIKNMDDMKAMEKIVQANKEGSENCGIILGGIGSTLGTAAGIMAASSAGPQAVGTVPTATLLGISAGLFGTVAAMCGATAKFFDGNMLKSIQSAISHSQCIRIDNRWGAFYTTDTKECG
ncbi:hypothetical protein [Mycobacterium sp. D16R24]|uniref:hypothetical protein n=1 Tax=Mycobacterium sp. D16R24 TaxID=1855656 RepID=UPI0009937172|nr:hypothetical protein [Mycobacterium sp. D16R24]